MRASRDQPFNLVPVTARDYRELARRRLPRQLFEYIDGGAFEERTMRSNVTDLERVLLRQIVMRDVSTRDQAIEVLGQRLTSPVILGPVALVGMFARRGEVQAARAAEAAGIPFTSSTLSVCSVQEVAGVTSNPPWFQLYVIRDRGYAESLMARAQAVNSPVLLLTVDMGVPGARHRDRRAGVIGDISAWARTRRGLDLVSHPRWMADVALRGRPLTFGDLEQAVPGASKPTDFMNWISGQFDASVTWDDIAWVREHWSGRLVLKGVLDPDDARRALDVGVDGVIVSNHGGRQLDSVRSSVGALPGVVEAVGDQTEVLVDGGAYTGLDVVKLVAMGARAVLLGRAWTWAVAARGETGVNDLLEVIKSEIDVALALTGTTSVRDLDRSALDADSISQI